MRKLQLLSLILIFGACGQENSDIKTVLDDGVSAQGCKQYRGSLKEGQSQYAPASPFHSLDKVSSEVVGTRGTVTKLVLLRKDNGQWREVAKSEKDSHYQDIELVEPGRYIFVVTQVRGGGDYELHYCFNYKNQKPTPDPNPVPLPPLPNTPLPPPPPGGTYKGTVNTNSSSFQPNGTKGFEYEGGVLKAELSSLATGDFDLYLQKKEGVRWVDVGNSTNEGHSETITYDGVAGQYRWEIYAYEGSGEYTLKASK